MRRALILAIALVAGLAGGAIGGLVLQDNGDAPFAPAIARRPASLPPPAEGGVLLVWTHEHLPPGLADATAALAGVTHVTVVRGGTLDLAGARAGWRVPVDAIAIDPASYAVFAPAGSALRKLVPGAVLLGTTSADIRRLDAGDSARLAAGTTLSVAGVVDDGLVGAAEMVLDQRDPAAAPLDEARYLLVAYEGARRSVEDAVRAAAGQAVRFRGPGETPFLRDGDAVVPQAIIKQRFGEFSYRQAVGDVIEVDPEWLAANITTVDVPILGRVRCHRAITRALEGALAELQRDNLSSLVDADAFGGCWAPRRVRGSDRLSRHAWGVAFDVNAAGNPTGLGSAQDPRLVAVMRRWGFTSGGAWLVPDPAHFEYLQRPRR